MMNALCWLLFTLLMLLGSVAHAEGECPPGMFPTNPAGAQGPVGCAPIPGYNNSQQQTQTQPPPAEWITQWGAMATDGGKGILGSATGRASKLEAEHAAMSDCQAKGGSPCKLQVAYNNECAVLVTADHGFNVTAATTLLQASQVGMKTCTDAKDTNCHVYYSACSPPKRIR